MTARQHEPGSDLPAPPLASPEEEAFWGKVSAQVARRRRVKHARHQRIASTALILLVGLPSALWMVHAHRRDRLVDYSYRGSIHGGWMEEQGGGTETPDVIGIGSVGTKGRGGGTGSYGSGVGNLGGNQNEHPVVEFEDDTFTESGHLDQEQIDRVIRRNQGQIRYCHESLLARYPALDGEVTLLITLRRDGTVAQTQIVSSTANNPELEACLALRVSTWFFPPSENGGTMRLFHSFRFKAPGK
jgi:hypothetical protein